MFFLINLIYRFYPCEYVFLVVFSFFEKTTYCCRSRRLSVRPSVVCGNNFFSRELVI